MKSTKTYSKLLVACMALIGTVTFLKASYYQPDFFPMGITGINHTGYGTPEFPNDSGVPYGNVENWAWDQGSQSEKALIDSLGVNCIGCQPAHPYYMFNYGSTDNDYLHKVCMAAGAPGTDSAIYLILSSYSSRKQYLKRDDCDTTGDSCIISDNLNVVPSGFFGQDNYKNDTLHVVWGPLEFHPKNMKLSSGSFPNCLKSESDNWREFYGTDPWLWMVDTAMARYYTSLSQGNHYQYIWGYNLFVENPAIYRNADTAYPWHGVWKADSIILDKFRDTVDSRIYNNVHPWVIAKGACYPMHRAGYNIFDELRDIDAFLIHSNATPALYNYGQQEIFDLALYFTKAKDVFPGNYYDDKNGLHSEAIYFQKYGNTPGGPSGQKRRWMGGLWLEWRVEKSSDPQNPTKVRSRRSCPPEIRCMTYLNLSRGAKGMFFVCWSGPTTYYYKSSDTDSTLLNDIEPNIAIPVNSSNYTKYFENYRGVGLRDYQGYPFGYWGSARDSNWYADNDSLHRLNNGSTGNGSSTTYWHTNNWDTTYSYLAHSLIPEIKKLGPTLIQLDWVNGYSLNSTDPKWASPCPHEYVMDVSGVSYMDLGLFDHPYEPVGVEYFMLVNREGIADMTNRTVTVALDAGHWPGADSLSLTDIANKEHPQTLVREGDRFVFTQVFEPGEGKLYRVAPVNEPPITMLHH